MAGRKKKKAVRRAAQPAGKKLEPQQVCEDIVELYLLAVFGFFPLMFGMGDYGYANLVKTKAYIWFGLTAFWALCLGSYLLWCKRTKQPVTVRFHWFHGVVAAFFVICVLSACLSGSVGESLLLIRSSNTNSVLFMASYAVAFTGVSLFGHLKAIHIRALGVSVFLTGLLSVIQLGGHNPLLMYPEGLNYYNKYQEYTGAYLGTLGNVDVFAAFLCFSAPVLTVYAWRSGCRRDRLLWIPALLSLYMLFACDVDAGKVAFLAGLLFVLPVVVPNPVWARRAGILCAATAVLGVAVVYFWPGESGLFHEASAILHGRVDPSFGHDRVGIWQQAWASVTQRPVLGNGPGSGAWLIDMKTVNEERGRIVGIFNAHNTYLGYWMDTGILGLACYLILIGAGCFAWVKNRKEDLTAALGAGVIWYLIQDFFNINVVTTAPFLWISLGLLVRKWEEKGENTYGALQGAEQKKPIRK